MRDGPPGGPVDVVGRPARLGRAVRPVEHRLPRGRHRPRARGERLRAPGGIRAGGLLAGRPRRARRGDGPGRPAARARRARARAGAGWRAGSAWPSGGARSRSGSPGRSSTSTARFFEEQTLKNLVYTAPFAAPLAYTGLGFLLLLDRMVDSRTVDWARWVVFLALGGFVGNFVLTLADHAQNGFFRAVGVDRRGRQRVGRLEPLRRAGRLRQPPPPGLALAVMAAQVGVGLLGFYLHVMADLRSPAGSLWDRFLYGAPLFAPLLFADLAMLAALGIWGVARTQSVLPPATAMGKPPRECRPRPVGPEARVRVPSRLDGRPLGRRHLSRRPSGRTGFRDAGRRRGCGDGPACRSAWSPFAGRRRRDPGTPRREGRCRGLARRGRRPRRGSPSRTRSARPPRPPAA